MTDEADKEAPTRENSERLATWIPKRLAKVIRVYASVREIRIRQIVEEALAAWVEANPLTAEEVERALSLDED